MDYEVILLAAGAGKRMGAGYNKLFLAIDNRPIISYTLEKFMADKRCMKVYLVIQQTERNYFEELLKKENYSDGRIQFVGGGEERQYSVYNGLKQVKADLVLVHDGARPFIRLETVHELAEAAAVSGAAIAAVPVKDTIKRILDDEVVETIDRSSLWQVQTPQAFRLSILLKAHEQARKEQFLGTDEASLVERIGHPVKIVESDYDNIKLTTPEDLFFAKAILAKQKELPLMKEE